MKKHIKVVIAASAVMALAPVQTAFAAEDTAQPVISDTASDAVFSDEEVSADLAIEMPADDSFDAAKEDALIFDNDDQLEEDFLESKTPEADMTDTAESESTNVTEDETADETANETADAPETKEDTSDESADASEVKVEEDSETAVKFEANLADASKYENPKVAEFVVRMYNNFLQRDPEEKGLNHWYNQLTKGDADGAVIVEQFLNSNEFLGRNLNTDAFLNVLYQGILGRNADTKGKQSWVDTSKKGVSRNYIAANFVTSNEFKRFCDNHGIEAGEYPLTESRDQDIKLTEWVNRFYQNCLSRSGDTVGLNFWTGRLLDKRYSGADVASGFMFSNENTAKNLSDKEFIESLYKTILGRSADATGMACWTTYLDNGVSRKYITDQMIQSKEFARACSNRGIEVGRVKLTENRDQNYQLTTYCTNTYKSLIDRKPTADELNNLTGKLLSGALNHANFPAYFFSSNTYTSKNKTAEEFIKDAYAALLKRDPSASELKNQLNDLSNIYDNNRAAFLNNITGSGEYVKKSRSRSIPILTNDWVELGSEKFFYNGEGLTHTGWLRNNGRRFYLDPEKKGMIQTGWAYIDGYKFYFYDDGVMATDLDDIIGPQSSYFIHVYKWGNYVIVFAKDGDNGYIIPCKVMICSAGVNTPVGYYTTPATYRWLTMIGGSKSQWCTQIWGDYLFHSIPYVVADNTQMYNESMYNKLGTTQSAGCIRLQAGYAKWVYDNCGAGTQVYIDPNNNSGPFDKPDFETIPSWHTWDPTDPTANYLCDVYGCTHHIQMP